MATHFCAGTVGAGMFYEQRMTVPNSPAALRSAYESELAGVVDAVGRADAVAATGVEAETLESLEGDGETDLTLEEAAEIAALEPGSPDAETITIEACEHLLLGMSTAVLDVETLASHLDIELEPREVQQKIERRAPMTFDEFVNLQYTITDRFP